MNSLLVEKDTPEETASGHPWDLSRLPGYRDALEVEAVHADAITPAEFTARYVNRNRPCRLIGAVKHWPAFQKWQETSYFRKAMPKDHFVYARSECMAEFASHAPQPLRDQLEARKRMLFKPVSFLSFLDGPKPPSGQHVIHSWPLVEGEPLGELLADVAGYRFLKKLKKSRVYATYRAFFYRGSYTDWHYHPTDEALMCQVVGAKEVLLLPPDQQSWDALWPVVQENGYLYGIDLDQYPKVAALRPYRVIVEPGDALYIPVYWWHAVQTLDDKFGVTVAATFATPVHVNADLSYPAARLLFRQMLSPRMALFACAAVVYASVRRLFCGHAR